MSQNSSYRRLRFSLRTLFVVVTVCAIAVAWFTYQIRTVHHRQDMLRQLRSSRVTVINDQLARDLGFFRRGRPKEFNAECEVSWLRKWLGDETIYLIKNNDETRALPFSDIQTAFPGIMILDEFAQSPQDTR